MTILSFNEQAQVETWCSIAGWADKHEWLLAVLCFLAAVNALLVLLKLKGHKSWKEWLFSENEGSL